jgi:hypothetical protein
VVSENYPLASVEAWGNSSVEAWGNSSVVARENSSVVAWGNSSVVARGNSSVEARENSSVEARGNSSVELRGFSQASVFSDNVKVQLFDLGRFIKPNDNIQNFALYHGIDIVDGFIILYKAVSKDLASFYDEDFRYPLRGKVEHACDPSVLQECSYGLHVSTLDWAKEFGKGRADDFKILECQVPIEEIIVPKESNGKVRSSELTVIRILE